jgi:single-stranded DNA-binding protein
MRLNSVLFTGRLGRDPVCVQSNGDHLVYLNLADNHPVTKQVSWHKFIVLGDAAATIANERTLRKGDLVLVYGELESLGRSGARAIESEVRVLNVVLVSESKQNKNISQFGISRKGEVRA